MNRNLISKIFIILLILSTSLMCFFTSNAHAVNVKQEDYQLESDEKIMEYDAITNETKEVNMEELKQLIEIQNKSTNNVTSYNSISPYNPYSEKDLTQDTIMPLYEPSARRITDTGSYPYRTTCRVSVENSSGTTRYATAAIVGPKVALTAAHCIFDATNGNAVFKNWTIYPGYNGNSYYGTACGWSKVYYSSKWIETHSYEYDWAICVLESDVGNQVGWFGVQSYGSNSELNGISARVLGYPGDIDYGFTLNAIYQYETGEKITSVADRYFKYSAYTFEGFSGGPIIRSDNYIVGIHYGKTSNIPTGVRITQEMINIIRNINNS